MVPTPSTTAANTIFAVSSAALFLLAWGSARTFLLTQRVSDMLVANCVVWLIGAQYALLHYPMGEGAFWIAHLLEVGGIGMVAIPAALDLRFAVASRPIQGKPGRLREEEFAEIRRHPAAGRDLLSGLGGFSEMVLQLVLSHRERADGPGYPNQVPAGELDFDVRILTVADVFDALTADRVYREAWTLERALALLDQEAGTAFDPDCVAALRTVVQREPTAAPAPVPAAAWSAIHPALAG